MYWRTAALLLAGLDVVSAGTTRALASSPSASSSSSTSASSQSILSKIVQSTVSTTRTGFPVTQTTTTTTTPVAGNVAVAIPQASTTKSTAPSPSSIGAVYVTTSNGTYLLSQNAGGSYVAAGAWTGSCDVAGGCWVLTMDTSSTGYKQTITGFGAAITDTTVYVYNRLNPAAKLLFMQDFFSASGINFNLMRHTIGSTDLTPPGTNYTYDDTAGDSSLARFNLGVSGLSMVGFINAAKSVQSSIKLIGASWSAPGWMKANGAQQGWTNPNNYLNGAYTTPFINYFIKYLKTFASLGITIDYLSVQNEPLNSQSTYPTMYVPAQDMANFIPQVAQALSANSLSTKLMVYDHNTDQPDYPQAVVTAASAYTSQLAVGWHCYATNTDWSTIARFVAANPGIPNFMTECWTSPTIPWNSVADFNLGPLQNYASGVLAWTLASSTTYGPAMPGACSTCRGLAVVDTLLGTYVKTLDYWLMGHFSKFIQRGAIALNTTGSYDFGGNAKFEAQAFLNPDGTKVIVIENTFGSAYLQLTINVQGGGAYNGKVLGSAVTTWVIPKGA